MKNKPSLNERIDVVFENWKSEAMRNPEARVIYSETKGGATPDRRTVTKSELEEFVRVWSDDTTVPFYKVRSEMNKHWYIASDLLINVYANGKVTWCKGGDNSHGRRRYKIETKAGVVNPCLANIRNIVLAKNVSEGARREFEERGIEGFKYTEQHHPEGHKAYKKGHSERNNERENSNIQTLTKTEHKMVHSLGRNGRIWEDDPERSMEVMKKLGKMSASGEKVCVVYEKIDRTTGRVIEQGKE